MNKPDLNQYILSRPKLDALNSSGVFMDKHTNCIAIVMKRKIACEIFTCVQYVSPDQLNSVNLEYRCFLAKAIRECRYKFFQGILLHQRRFQQ